jgi:hypothetical protein
MLQHYAVLSAELRLCGQKEAEKSEHKASYCDFFSLTYIISPLKYFSVPENKLVRDGT